MLDLSPHLAMPVPLASTRRRKGRWEEALFGEIRQLQALFEFFPDPLLFLDARGEVSRFNPAAEAWLGASPEGLRGAPLGALFEPDDHPVLGELLALAGQRQPVSRRLELTPKGQPSRPALLSLFAFDAPDGQIEGLVAVFRDLAGLRMLERTLEAQNAELRELDRLKNAFVSSVSHELRTPLTSIFGFTEFLQENVAGSLNSMQQLFIGEIMAGAKRLGRLVDDLLDFARLESGTFRLDRRTADLVETLRRVLESMAPQAVARDLELAMAACPERVELAYDVGRIEQVVTNLVANALKFTPPGGRIDLSVVERDADVLVAVTDTGTGIAPEHLPRLFQRYYQARIEGEPLHGMGLGLSICEALIAEHGGTIGVESAPGAGSRFWFALPRTMTSS